MADRGDINIWGDLLCSPFSHLCGPWKTIKRGGLLPGARHSSDSCSLMSEQRGRRCGGIWTCCCIHGPRHGCDIWALLDVAPGLHSLLNYVSGENQQGWIFLFLVSTLQHDGYVFLMNIEVHTLVRFLRQELVENENSLPIYATLFKAECMKLVSLA